MKLEGALLFSFLADDEVEEPSSFWLVFLKLEELCLFLLGTSSHHFLKGDGNLPRRPGVLVDKSPLILLNANGGTSPLVLQHEVEDLPFLSKGWGEDQTSLFQGWGELHHFFLSVSSLPYFEKVKGVVRIFFPYRFVSIGESPSRGDLCIASTRMHPYLTVTTLLHADALVVRGDIYFSV